MDSTPNVLEDKPSETVVQYNQIPLKINIPPDIAFVMYLYFFRMLSR